MDPSEVNRSTSILWISGIFIPLHKDRDITLSELSWFHSLDGQKWTSPWSPQTVGLSCTVLCGQGFWRMKNALFFYIQWHHGATDLCSFVWAWRLYQPNNYCVAYLKVTTGPGLHTECADVANGIYIRFVDDVVHQNLQPEVQRAAFRTDRSRIECSACPVSRFWKNTAAKVPSYLIPLEFKLNEISGAASTHVNVNMTMQY